MTYPRQIPRYRRRHGLFLAGAKWQTRPMPKPSPISLRVNISPVVVRENFRLQTRGEARDARPGDGHLAGCRLGCLGKAARPAVTQRRRPAQNRSGSGTCCAHSIGAHQGRRRRATPRATPQRLAGRCLTVAVPARPKGKGRLRRSRPATRPAASNAPVSGSGARLGGRKHLVAEQLHSELFRQEPTGTARPTRQDPGRPPSCRSLASDNAHAAQCLDLALQLGQLTRSRRDACRRARWHSTARSIKDDISRVWAINLTA